MFKIYINLLKSVELSGQVNQKARAVASRNNGGVGKARSGGGVRPTAM
ncbi:hypothetical protein [Salegentibacter echinorum]|nr:hypothetical protein [Salegentibacter echinorum]